MPLRLRGSETVCSYSGKIFHLFEIRTLAIYISYVSSLSLCFEYKRTLYEYQIILEEAIKNVRFEK